MYQIFDESGNFLLKGYDPFRLRNEKPDFHSTIFFDDGNVRDSFHDDLIIFIRTINNPSPWCDAVRLCYAWEIPYFSKGNYSSIYLWR